MRKRVAREYLQKFCERYNLDYVFYSVYHLNSGTCIYNAKRKGCTNFEDNHVVISILDIVYAIDNDIDGRYISEFMFKPYASPMPTIKLIEFVAGKSGDMMFKSSFNDEYDEIAKSLFIDNADLMLDINNYNQFFIKSELSYYRSLQKQKKCNNSWAYWLGIVFMVVVVLIAYFR